MEEHWIVGCTKGKREAQERLYHHYSSKVMGVCRRYADTSEDAKDIFQEAFINIFKSLQRKIDIDSLEAWIRKITANTAINYYYKNRKHQKNLSADIMIQHDDSNYDYILSELGKEDLLNLLSALPGGCRHIFNLFVIEGYSHKEIADLMKISEGTSKSQLSRAKEIMKSKLKALDHVRYESYACQK